MNILYALFIGIALAMDSMAVSITCGLQKNTLTRRKGFLLAALFAGFHLIMPIFGGAIGTLVGGLIESLDHWIAFALLFVIGLKMFIEGCRFKVQNNLFSIHKPSVAVILALATSIDAFVVGISVVLESGMIVLLQTSVIISIIVFALSFTGVEMGRKAYFFKPKLAQKIGGAILMLLGIKILFEHGAIL